ncbi:MAG: carbamoyl-phosphate synthase large subunit [Methylacidiphilales bacterium]|nr:carbamoyl-phosphate synthase large subunit [Candidatus Methylacidiphilales bacterium]
MPRRNDINHILIIGSGPIVIGQAAEFDYSGVQACRALKEDGFKVSLINSNPATIMTDLTTTDSIYLEPLDFNHVKKILEIEKPDALLPTMGGQTALNLALKLDEEGILNDLQIEMIGVKSQSIKMAEDRNLFKQAMSELGLRCPESRIVNSVKEALDFSKEFSYPIIIRPSYTLGGSGGGIAFNQQQLLEIVKHGLFLSQTKQVLIEQSMIGYKEFELEAIRDKENNCIIVCSIENFDPMGTHTGDSITVAPIQTLTDKEYQLMRTSTIEIMKKIGIESGGSNVQFAVQPKTGEQFVIEMNPRVSRSSALASKATGYPIARIAAKLAVGYSLIEIKNNLTIGEIPASFEPTIDYVVTKIPRFNFEKFSNTADELGTQMKSVGEVMAIGTTFNESLLKAITSLEIDRDGLQSPIEQNEIVSNEVLFEKISRPSSQRLWYLAESIRRGIDLETIYSLTSIDPWFLRNIKDVIDLEIKLSACALSEITQDLLSKAKQSGLTDTRIATLLNTSPSIIRELRVKFEIIPVYKRIDTCAAEFDTETNYCYSSYFGKNELQFKINQPKVIILGCGPNRIGQGIEFDYCCVHALMAFKQLGYYTIMVNCNPETVSTDYDLSNALYFEPISFEHIYSLVCLENPLGIVVQFGGQTPLKLVQQLADHGISILGSGSETIDMCEDRKLFQKLINSIGLLQPVNTTAVTIEEALKGSEIVGFPLLVRPSYVLGGRAMEIAYSIEDLEIFARNAFRIASDKPLLLDRFLSDAIEIDIDLVTDGEEVFIPAIMQHIESAGVHSGDSACSIPPFSLPIETQQELRNQATLIARSIKAIGLVNIQFALKDSQIYLLEVNPRASRSIPFVSKSTGHPLAKYASFIMGGKKLKDLTSIIDGVSQQKLYCVKESIFPFIKFNSSDILLGPEMKSTGEVMGRGETFEEAFALAQLAAGVKLKKSGNAFISLSNSTKSHCVPLAKLLHANNYIIYATKGTFQIINEAGIPCIEINKVSQGSPHILELLDSGVIDLIINTTEGRQSIADSFTIRRRALLLHIPITTTIPGSYATCRALSVSDTCKPRKL